MRSLSGRVGKYVRRRAGDRKCGTRKHETRAWQETAPLSLHVVHPRRARNRVAAPQKIPRYRSGRRAGVGLSGRMYVNACSPRILRAALIKLNCGAFLRRWRNRPSPSRKNPRFTCHFFRKGLCESLALWRKFSIRKTLPEEITRVHNFSDGWLGNILNI